MSTLSEYHAGLTIGTVESVRPDAVDVLLDVDAPHGTALNARTLTRFPRISGYVVIPSEAGAVIGLVTWLGVERDRHRWEASDDDLVDLASPRRRMRVLPLGTVHEAVEGERRLERGVLLFPTVGDPVLLATAEQLRTLALPDSPDHVRLGTSPLAGGGIVRVHPDRMLARHLAILGNTGSGKSCSAALFLRRVVAAAKQKPGAGPSIIVLDANGEYQNSFDDLGDLTVRRFAVDPTDGDELLRVPAWLWNSREWVAFAGARRAAQAPYLRQALRVLRRGGSLADPEHSRIATVCRSFHIHVRRRALQVGAQADFRQRMDSGSLVQVISESCRHFVEVENDENLADLAERVVEECGEIKDDHFDGKYWSPIGVRRWDNLATCLNTLLLAIETEASDEEAVHEDDPLFFYVDDLAEAIELAALDEESGSAIQWIAPLTFRLRHLLNDRRLRSISSTREGETLESLLDSYVAANQVSVIDLSLVPSHARRVIVAVLTRFFFEAHERYRRMHSAPLSTVILAEEAHSFISRGAGHGDDDSPASSAELCREAFESVAREGRKFGLSLALTSQRPSELSETVLSQCNTFLVHRVVNDVDQSLLRRLVPDALGDLLAELPSLPQRAAMLLGSASEIPTLVTVDELEEGYRPQSADPSFLKTWQTASDGRPRWSEVVAEWVSEGNAEDLKSGAECDSDFGDDDEPDVPF